MRKIFDDDLLAGTSRIGHSRKYGQRISTLRSTIVPRWLAGTHDPAGAGVLWLTIVISERIEVGHIDNNFVVAFFQGDTFRIEATASRSGDLFHGAKESIDDPIFGLDCTSIFPRAFSIFPAARRYRLISAAARMPDTTVSGCAVALQIPAA